MSLEDFDIESVPSAPAVTDRVALEADQTERMTRYRRVRDLIVTPEVAHALRDGWSYTEIAEVLGVDKGTVAKHAKSAEMQTLIDRESRRIMNNLTRRKLDTVNYRDLTVSLGVLIDKARLLRNEPTEIVQHEAGTATRLAEIFFRRRQRQSGEGEEPGVIDVTPDRIGDGVLGDVQQPSETDESSLGTDSSGSDEPSV